MTELAHSTLGASSMYRWSECPGSVRMCRGLPDVTTSYAQEGTDCHELMALVLLDGKPTEQQALKFNGEMHEAVGVYRNEINHQLFHAGLTRPQAMEKKALFVEHRFDLSKIFLGCFGTADTVVWDAKNRVLYVTDLKYGAGIAVEAEKNSQLLYYALGALISLNLPAIDVEIVVVQPRCPHRDGPVRRWRVSALELLEFQSDLVRFARATQDPQAPLKPGGHCKFCKAAAVCPALHRTANEVAVSEFSAVQPSYDPAKLAAALGKVDVLEDWCKSVRAFAYAEASHGRVVPGYKIVSKRPVRRWIDGAEDKLMERLDDKFIPAFYSKPEMISPAQAEKVLKENRIKGVDLDDLIVSISSGGKLVRENEAGESVRVGPAADFSALTK